MSKTPAILPDWIAADWGTSHLRAWAMSNSGVVLGSATSGDGMVKISSKAFEPALMNLISGWLADGKVTPVVTCGMVGSRQGWVEAPYKETPCAPTTNSRLARARTIDPRIDVFIVAGIKQIDPADVMRGEETQIAGLLARNPGFDGVACLPGTHTKWVRISAGQIVKFLTFLTGELFSLLSSQSVLRHSIAPIGWDGSAFEKAVHESITLPSAIAAKLFQLRSESLISDLPPETARARLSGYLIGLELGAARHFWRDEKVAIIGEETISDAYQKALDTQGCLSEKYDAQLMTLAGISNAKSNFGTLENVK